MSLVKTLARVAGGVVLAKAMGGMMSGSRPRQSRSGGGLLDQIMQSGQRADQSGQGGLGGMLGQVLGGQTGGAGTGRPYGGSASRGAQGGLGGLLDQLTGSAAQHRTTRRSAPPQGGLGDLLGQLTGGSKPSRSAQSGGGIGDLLGGLLGGAAATRLATKDTQATNDASFGELLNDALSKNGEPEVQPTAEQNAVAGLMLRAMIQAAKADGKIDDNEKQRLLGELGDLDSDEQQFIREQLSAPSDVEGLARSVPEGLEAQVYTMSLMAIDLDHAEEARYLHRLAEALDLERETVNEIHEKVGVQPLYS